MTTLVIDAVHQKGVFRPINPVSLPENAPVKVLVQTPEITESAKTERPSLFGAFPEIAAINDDDIAWVKGLWQEGLEKQLRILQGGE